MRESTISALIRQAIALDGRAILTRNNVGMLTDSGGRHVRYGLGTGSADLVGMIIGSGRVFCFEVKRPGMMPTTHQKAWARAVRARGGFCATVRSVEDAMAALGRALEGASE